MALSASSYATAPADAKSLAAAPNAVGCMAAAAAKWRVFPAKLSGQYLDLEPLRDEHFEALHKAAGHDASIWRYHPFAPETFATPADLKAYYTQMWAVGVTSGVVLTKDTRQPVGSYSLMDIQPQHRGLEIGAVWIAASAQKGIFNTEAVQLLLRHAFEELGAYRVCWKTDSRNVVSQAVASKLGAVKEGVLRTHYLVKGQTHRRDSVYFSWLDTDYVSVKPALAKRVAEFVPPKTAAAVAAAAAAANGAAAGAGAVASVTPPAVVATAAVAAGK